MTAPDRRLTIEEFAAESGASIDLLERFIELGQLRPDDEGRFDARDAAMVATVRGLEEAGVTPDDITWLVREVGAGFAAIGPMYTTPAPRDGPSFLELQRGLGPLGERLSAVYTAFGLSEPEADRPMRSDEVSIMARFVRMWGRIDPDGDAYTRTARLTGEATRRVMEGWLDAWDATARPVLTSQGAPGDAPPADPTDPEQNPAISGAELMRDLLAWLGERQLERTLNDRIITAMESALVRAGRLPARPDVPTAIAFVDLTDYASLTERLGDEAAAQAAAQLAELADACARAYGGRVMKLLGDGVLMRFEHPRTAVEAIVDLLREMVASGLPPGHAGIAAGRVVVRDGDVFGRTVNLAARISAHAVGGQLLVEEGVVLALGAEPSIVLQPVDPATLKGINEPVALWRVVVEGG